MHTCREERSLRSDLVLMRLFSNAETSCEVLTPPPLTPPRRSHPTRSSSTARRSWPWEPGLNCDITAAEYLAALASAGGIGATTVIPGLEIEEIDCAGQVILPGLVDAHMHSVHYADSLTDLDLLERPIPRRGGRGHP